LPSFGHGRRTARRGCARRRLVRRPRRDPPCAPRLSMWREETKAYLCQSAKLLSMRS
jgi:hypothetical protein